MSRTISVRRRPWAVLAVAVAAALAAGCSSSANADGSDEPAEVATYAGAAVAFGESWTYGNGLVVEVRKPVRFVPSSLADGVEGVEGVPVKFRVSVINGSSSEFDPSTIGVVVESGGVEASQVLDPSSRIELTGPARVLTRGDVAAFDLGFVVADPDDVTVSLTPAISGYEPLVASAK